MAKIVVNGQENGVIAFKGDHEPCAVYIDGVRQDNVSYTPELIEGENSVEYKSEYKKNIRTMQIEGNSEQFQGSMLPPPQAIDITGILFGGSDGWMCASQEPITLPNNQNWKVILTKTGSETLPDGYTIAIGDTQADALAAKTTLYWHTIYDAPVVNAPFYIGVGNIDTGIPSGYQTYDQYFKDNFKLEIQLDSSVQVPCADYPQSIRNCGDRRLPADYQEVEYIESTGTQFIDTGFKPNQDTRVVCDFQLTETYASFAFGARDGSGVPNPRAYTFNMGSGGRFVTNYNSITTNVFEWDLSRHIVDKNKNVTTLDNSSRTVEYVTFTSPKTLTLFACNQTNSYGYLPSKMKLYSCQMYDNGTLIRDFIPCYRISDNSVGLYDLVNGVFYTNKGTGKFIKGANIEMSLELKGENLFDISRVADGSINTSTGKNTTTENRCRTHVYQLKKGIYRVSIKDGVCVESIHFYRESAGGGGVVWVSATDTLPYELQNGRNVMTFEVSQYPYVRLIFKPDNNEITDLNTSLLSEYDVEIVDTSTITTIPIPQSIVARDKRLPSEYQQVEYIESTGTQYIDTGVIPNNETGFSLDVSFPDVSTDMFRFGCRKDSGNTRFILGTNNNMYFGFGGTINQIENKWAINKDTFYNAKLNFLNSRVANLNNKNDVALRNLGVDNMVYSIIMFGRNSGGSITSSAQTIKACRISQGTEIIRDFIPCYRKSDNVVGMYDIANGAFYTNNGTGEFIKGANSDSVPLRFAKYKNADYLLVDRLSGTVNYYQYSTEGDPTKPLSEQLENIPPFEYDITLTDLGQALLNLPTQNATNTITITSTPSVSKLSVNYAKWGGAK